MKKLFRIKIDDVFGIDMDRDSFPVVTLMLDYKQALANFSITEIKKRKKAKKILRPSSV